MKKSKVLFIGSHLSKSRGTKSVAEILKTILSQDINVLLTSKYEDKLFRLLDIISHIFLKKYDWVNIDVFSDQAFLITKISLFLLRFKNKKVVLSFHGGRLPDFYQKNKKEFKDVIQKADLLVSPSQYLVSFFREEGIEIQYNPNPILLEKFPFDRTNIIKGKLLWVRAFDKIYNPWLAIKTLHRVKAKYPNATLTMVGPDKGELRSVKNLALELNLNDSVFFEGPIPNQQLYKYYQTHQVYLNTTLYESFGVAVMEAASCGIPIVTTRVGEIPFIWEDEVSVKMLNHGSETEMAGKVLELMDNPVATERMSFSARKVVLEFNPNNVRKNWLTINGKFQA